MRPVRRIEHPLRPPLHELSRDRADVLIARRTAFRAVVRRRELYPAASGVEQTVHRAHTPCRFVDGCGKAPDVIDDEVARQLRQNRLTLSDLLATQLEIDVPA